MAATPEFQFNDAASLDDNLKAFSTRLVEIDADLGSVLAASLEELRTAAVSKTSLLSSLYASLAASSDLSQANTTQQPVPAAPAAAAPSTAPSKRWFLGRIQIEGFRGVNNEGAPLDLKFHHDRVNSVSAPNGVGKSSIFDALTYALTGGIPKLDRLLQVERPQDYYLNRFHPGTVGTITLTLVPDDGGPDVLITVKRSSTGARSVSAPPGVDGGALLRELNREFVLLDAHTFHTFIDERALERGRSFSGLLGLAAYSDLRQELQALANTRAFNSHFDVSGHAARRGAATRSVAAARQAIRTDYQALVGQPLEPTRSDADAQADCHAALHGIPLLTDHCANQPFMDIDVDKCIDTVRSAEGGPKRDRLVELVRTESTWVAANKELPSAADLDLLVEKAKERTQALDKTAGELLNKLYRLSEQVLTSDGWPSPSLCPTCERDDGTSVLEKVQAKLGDYTAVETATGAVVAEWIAKGWSDLIDLERLALGADEPPRLQQLSKAGGSGALLVSEAEELVALVKNLRGRAQLRLDEISTEKTALEKELPPSLVTVTTAVEAVRRLQKSWRDVSAAEAELKDEHAHANALNRLKGFLDTAADTYALAEAHMAKERLAKVEPICRALFKDIMFAPVVPALTKPEGSEELSIKLAEFWGLQNLSAQALLSESFRNAFAISVYLAAASLYGGPPGFMVLDDVTSSFDAGHQQHLVELIRSRFARPMTPGGPQVILLTHDTLLEKLFNKHSGTTQWWHQRLEGTARTAVLPQAGAVNKVRDATIDMLNAGRVQDAAPWIRQYLEYTLHTVIDRLRIPVPMDLAFGDERATAGEYLNAINSAVALHDKAGDLVLDAGQTTALGLNSATIVGNYLSHWATGQTQAFSAPALLGVMAAIDAFPDNFKYEPAPGQPKKFYRRLNLQ